MKILTAVGLTILLSAAAPAQRRMAVAMAAPQRTAAPIAPPSGSALGGSFGSTGSSRPLGGVALPTFPAAGKRKTTVPPFASRYVGPVYYVPGYSDVAYQSSGYSSFNQPASPGPYYSLPLQQQSPQPPVIINQYFGSRSSTTQTEDGNNTTTYEAAPADAQPGDPLVAPARYYLIAYKDHSIYSALAYWLEGDTLHYVTTQNTHNQASLALIDLDQTTKLNADASVPFSLAGR